MINTSATQLKTLKLCPRKWVLEKIFKCPQPKSPALYFGSILHAALERYLKQEPLWPEGWETDPETKKRCTPAEAALIQVLVQSGIDNGYVERRPGGQVEKEMKLQITPEIQAIGYLDYHVPDQAWDHKTSKSSRYFLSPNGLKGDLQMNLYGKWLVEHYWRKLGKVPPPVITLTHNQFLKDIDSPETRQRSAEVSPLELDKFFEDEIVPLAKLQQQLHNCKDPFEIPDPPKDACNAYGGCPYQPICAGSVSYLQYRARFATEQSTLPMTTSPQEFLARRAGAAAAPAVNPPPPAASTPAAAPAQAANTNVPPWAGPTCPACSKTATPGFNAKRNPCKICIAATKKSTDGYEWAALGDGTIQWWEKGKGAPVATQTAPVAAGTGAKTAYTSQDFTAKLQACKNTDQVSELTMQASEGLGDGTPELLLFLELAEKRIDELVDAATPQVTPERLRELKEAITGGQTPEAVERVLDTARAEQASVEQLGQLRHDAEARITLLANNNPAAPTTPPPTVVPPAGAPVKRGPGRPRKNPLPNVPTEGPVPTPAPAPVVEEPTEAGFVLVVGADVVHWPGRRIVAVEELLNDMPDYWSTTKADGTYDSQAAFRRRDAIRAACVAGSELIKGLDGFVVVQRFRDPDCSNVMSALWPLASARIVGGTL